jgi:CRISPR-associated protein Csm3
MNDFATFTNRTFIRATLVMETALAVGARLSLEPTGTDMPVVKGPDGLPYIPGSSIKGVLRFQTERLLRGRHRQPDLWACDPFESPCVPDEDRDGRVGKEKLWVDAKGKDEAFSQKVLAASCTACRLFGSPWFAGRLAFKDAYLSNGDHLPVVTQVRDGVGIDRDLGAARSGIKYDFETVVPGARFNVEIVAENLDDRELGLLLAVLRLWQEGAIAIGGKSTRGPGWGRLEGLTVQRVDSSNLVHYLLSGAAGTADLAPYLQAFQRWWQGEASDA